MSINVEATVDGIRFLYDGGEIEVDYNASNGDVVRLTIEPLEVNVTDGFRAAVKKACKCDSSSGGGGGSTGGGVLVVRSTVTSSGGNEVHTLDKTWEEIADAGYAVVYERQTFDDAYVDFYGIIAMIGHMDVYNIYVRFPLMEGGTTHSYETDAEDGYPSYTPSAHQ